MTAPVVIEWNDTHVKVREGSILNGQFVPIVTLLSFEHSFPLGAATELGRLLRTSHPVVQVERVDP